MSNQVDPLTSIIAIWGALTGTVAIAIQCIQWYEARKDKQAQLPNLSFRIAENKEGRNNKTPLGGKWDHWWYAYQLEITNIGGQAVIAQIYNQNTLLDLSSQLPAIIETGERKWFMVGSSRNLELPLKLSVIDSYGKVWPINTSFPVRPKIEMAESPKDADSETKTAM